MRIMSNSAIDELDFLTDSQKHQVLQNTTNNDPEEDINECNKCNRVMDEVDPLIEQKLTPKGPRTSSRQKKPPTTKNNDFLW